MDIVHLHERPEHLETVATWIHNEWWTDKPGHSVQTMAARLRQAQHVDAIPLSLLALSGDTPLGTVNLVDNDNEERLDLKPWLAALLVHPEHRGRGVGTALVHRLTAEARRLQVPCMYLGTDIPEYYLRLGADLFHAGPDDYRIMRIRTGSLGTQGTESEQADVVDRLSKGA